MRHLGFLVIWTFALTALVSGCSAQRTLTQMPRSGIEQLVLSTAAERSVTQIAGPDFQGARVYLEVTGLTKDADFVRETVASELQVRGAVIVTEATTAHAHRKNFGAGSRYRPDRGFFGIPAMNSILPIPEIALFKRNRQTARSRLRFTVIDTRTGETVGQAQEIEGKTVFTRLVILAFTFEWSDVVDLP